jgi:DNA repair protein RadC
METINTNEMVRQIRDQLYEQTKHLSDDELIAYYHQTAQRVMEMANETLRQWQIRKVSDQHVVAS